MLNTAFSDSSLLASLASAFQGKGAFKDDQSGTFVTPSPYPLCVFPNALDEALALQVRHDLLKEPFQRRSNDLYSFWQSSDLKSANIAHSLKAFREAIFSPQMINAVSTIVGIPLDLHHVDLAGQQYKCGDYLLCHDDRLEDRAVAFIFYLVSPGDSGWSGDCGGSLDLFPTDVATGEPGPVAEYSFFPKWNHFAFFQVSEHSYHQVAEVLSRDQVRVSITGWFHHPKISLSETPHLTPEYWVNPVYLEKKNLRALQKAFQRDSSIFIESFLRVDRYEELLSVKISHSTRSSPLHYRYLVPRIEDKAGNRMQEFASWLKSRSFDDFIIKILLSDCVDCAPEGQLLEIRTFKHRCFTLSNDSASEQSGLDVDFFMIDSGVQWDSEAFGGSMFWVEAKEPLLEVTPKANSLSLVFKAREDASGLYKFVKYVNAACGEGGFTMFSKQYSLASD